MGNLTICEPRPFTLTPSLSTEDRLNAAALSESYDLVEQLPGAYSNKNANIDLFDDGDIEYTSDRGEATYV
jgi:hypothetical protein